MAEGWTWMIFKLPASPNDSVSFHLKFRILPCSPVLGKPEFPSSPTNKLPHDAGSRHCQECLCSPTPKGCRGAAPQSKGRAGSRDLESCHIPLQMWKWFSARLKDFFLPNYTHPPIYGKYAF